MYLKLITLCLLSTSISFAEKTTAPSCLERMMDPLLTPPQKEFISKAENPASERIKIYTQFHREKYQDFAAQCRAQEAAQQTESRTSAIAAQRKDGARQQAQAQNSRVLLAGATQAATLLMNSDKPKTASTVSPATGTPAKDKLIEAAAAANAAAPNVTQAATKNSDNVTRENNSPASQSEVDYNSHQNVLANLGEPNGQQTSANLTDSDGTPVSKVEIMAQAQNVYRVDQRVGNAGKDVANSADSPKGFFDRTTKITEDAGERNKIVTALQKEVHSLGMQLSKYSKTASALSALDTSISAYLTAKQACTGSAEKAQLLCVESPGAEKVKTMMDIAGPVLAAVSSASKSCSSLNKITTLAGSGLLIAKAVCAGSKFMCDSACNKAVTELGKIETQFQKIPGIFSAEHQQMFQDRGCESSYCADLITDANTARIGFARIPPALKTERPPSSPGTSSAMVATCSGYAKELGIMAINILGIIKARDGAKECEKQLSVAGNGDISKQQHCEIPANAATEMCKCERNKMAAGCPGALVTTLNSNGVDTAGLNIKNSAGVSGFASGTPPTTPTPALNGLNNASSASAKGSGYNGQGASSSAGSGGGSSQVSDSAASGGSGGDSATSQANNDKSSRKWDFGSFGSHEGGGSAGAKGIGKNGSGIGDKGMDALKRKIASEQFAAEVSSSSGKSNWEKVKRMYLFKETSFLNGK